MAKKFPSAEFKTAVKALNVVLKASEKEAIKFVGIKKSEVVESFTNSILEFIEAEIVEQLPDEAINFYNNHIANAETDDDDAGAGTAGDTKEKKEKKKKTSMPKTVGVLATIHSTIVAGPVDKAGILAALEKAFPDREAKAMKSTINCQISGKSRPWRLEKSRKCTYEVTEDGKYSVK